MTWLSVKLACMQCRKWDVVRVDLTTKDFKYFKGSHGQVLVDQDGSLVTRVRLTCRLVWKKPIVVSVTVNPGMEFNCFSLTLGQK